MYLRLRFCLIATLIVALLGNAHAISVKGVMDGVSYSQKLDLDSSTSFSSCVSLDPVSGMIFKDMSAKGKGQNTIVESVSTNKNTVENEISGSGDLSTSSSSFGGDAGVLVSQAATFKGDKGLIGIRSESQDNEVNIIGELNGKGSLSEDIGAFSGDSAYVGGTISSVGVNLLDKDLSQELASNEMMISVDGIFVTDDAALGQFKLQATNSKGGPGASKPPSPTTTVDFQQEWLSSDGLHPETTSNGGYSDSYSLIGWEINSPLQLYLRNDVNLAGKGLVPEETGKAIVTAAETWDSHTTSAELFSDNIVISSSVSADKRDQLSVHAFKPITGAAIAYARTRTDGSGNVVESDVCYNTRYAWSTDWDLSNEKNTLGQYLRADVQSIALHELGHAVGLGDLYLLPENDNGHGYSDWNQAMNSYDGPQHNLGEGDLAGLHAIYSLPT